MERSSDMPIKMKQAHVPEDRAHILINLICEVKLAELTLSTKTEQLTVTVDGQKNIKKNTKSTIKITFRAIIDHTPFLTLKNTPPNIRLTIEAENPKRPEKPRREPFFRNFRSFLPTNHNSSRLLRYSPLYGRWFWCLLVSVAVLEMSVRADIWTTTSGFPMGQRLDRGVWLLVAIYFRSIGFRSVQCLTVATSAGDRPLADVFIGS